MCRNLKRKCKFDGEDIQDQSGTVGRLLRSLKSQLFDEDSGPAARRGAALGFAALVQGTFLFFSYFFLKFMVIFLPFPLTNIHIVLKTIT